MSKFEFSKAPLQKFTGRSFYQQYKNAKFLQNSENLETILSKSYQLRNTLKTLKPGGKIPVSGMMIEENIPLYVTYAPAGISVACDEFTTNRLTGLAAAYTYENRSQLTNIKSSEAISLGLTWDNSNADLCKLYLSCVTGTEHFYDQFAYWPLVCALRKLQLQKIPPALVVKIAMIKNNDGEKMSMEFSRNYETVVRMWEYFPGSKPTDLLSIMESAPQEVKKSFCNF